MILLASLAFFLLALYVVFEVGCRETPPPAGMSWFVVVRSLRVSKKARTRGDVVGGLTRRERRVQHVR